MKFAPRPTTLGPHRNTIALSDRPAPALHRPKIALLYSPSTADPHEQTYGTHCPEALESAGCDVVILDYHNCGIDLKAEKDRGSGWVGGMGDGQITLTYDEVFGAKSGMTISAMKDALITHYYEQAVDERTHAWLKKNGIDGFFAPGNHYNVVEAGQNPNSDRADIERAAIRVSREIKLPYMGVCGGMQRYIDTIGGEVFADIARFVGGNSVHAGDFQNHQVHRIRLIDGTALKQKHDHRATSDYVSSEHTQGILNTSALRAVLAEHGLQVAALDEGEHTTHVSKRVVEAIESIEPREYFVLLTQYHPETLQESVELKWFANSARNYHRQQHAGAAVQI